MCAGGTQSGKLAALTLTGTPTDAGQNCMWAKPTTWANLHCVDRHDLVCDHAGRVINKFSRFDSVRACVQVELSLGSLQTSCLDLLYLHAPDSGCRSHARVFELVIFLRPCQDAVSTFENHCLAGESTFGDPFQDSGVVRPATKPSILIPKSSTINPQHLDLLYLHAPDSGCRSVLLCFPASLPLPQSRSEFPTQRQSRSSHPTHTSHSAATKLYILKPQA